MLKQTQDPSTSCHGKRSPDQNLPDDPLMPYFEDNPLTGLVFQAGQADRDVDLRGMNNADALQRVETLLNGLERRGTVLIRFDEARGDGVETLFLPLGRRLLEARRAGRLKRCLPAEKGNAYFIEFDSEG